MKDTVAPTVATPSPAAGSYVTRANQAAFAVSGHVLGGQADGVDLRARRRRSATCTGGGWSATLDLTGARQGSFTLCADHTDAAGNAAAQDSRSFAKDTVAPTVAITAPGAGSYVTAANQGAFVVAAPARRTGGPCRSPARRRRTVACTAGTGARTLDLTGAPQGAITVNADHPDAAGNAAAQASRGFVKDTMAPTVAFTSPAAGSYVTAANQAAFQWSRAPARRTGGPCRSRGGDGEPDVHGRSLERDAQPDERAAGRAHVYADHSDAAGNAATQVSRAFVKDTVAPTVAFSRPRRAATSHGEPGGLRGVAARARRTAGRCRSRARRRRTRPARRGPGARRSI